MVGLDDEEKCQDYLKKQAKFDEAKKELPDMKDQTAVDKMLDDAISEDDPFGGVPRASLDDLFPQ